MEGDASRSFQLENFLMESQLMFFLCLFLLLPLRNTRL